MRCTSHLHLWLLVDTSNICLISPFLWKTRRQVRMDTGRCASCFYIWGSKVLYECISTSVYLRKNACNLSGLIHRKRGIYFDDISLKSLNPLCFRRLVQGILSAQSSLDPLQPGPQDRVYPQLDSECSSRGAGCCWNTAFISHRGKTPQPGPSQQFATNCLLIEEDRRGTKRLPVDTS